MKTGMARKIDDLGRIVIPAETRRLFNIREGDQLSISVEGDRIVLNKIEGVVSVGEHSFEDDRQELFEWEQRVGEDALWGRTEQAPQRLGIVETPIEP